MLGELEGATELVVADLEAGVGTLLRLQAGMADVVLVVAEPTTKSMEVARRAAGIAAGKSDVIVLGNRVRSEDDLQAIRTVLDRSEVVAIPEDPVIAGADRDGLAPIDVDGNGPGVSAITGLAERLGARLS